MPHLGTLTVCLWASSFLPTNSISIKIDAASPAPEGGLPGVVMRSSGWVR